jgi:hypothetical protein
LLVKSRQNNTGVSGPAMQQLHEDQDFMALAARKALAMRNHKYTLRNQLERAELVHSIIESTLND